MSQAYVCGTFDTKGEELHFIAAALRVACVPCCTVDLSTRTHVRVDCKLGTAILNGREIEVFTRQDLPQQKHREGKGQKVSMLIQPKWINIWLIEQFTRWRDGGPEMETNVAANVQASALVFGSIESSRTRSLVKVQEYIAGFA